VYDHYGLMRPRAMFGHCIWLDDEDFARMAATGSAHRGVPDLEPVPGQRPVRLRKGRRRGVLVSLAPTSAAAPRSRCCKR
jgi:guanine deaminase